MSANTLTITDNRTGKQYEVTIENGAIKAVDLRQIKTSADDFGLRSSTVTKVFSNIAVIRSINSQKKALTSKSHIYYCTENCPTKRSCRNGPTTSPITPLSMKA